MIILKNQAEIEIIKEGGQLLRQILNQLAKEIKPGITTKYLEDFTKSKIKKFNAKSAFFRYQGFPSQLCISVNDEIVHGIPKDRILNSGDIVSIDAGLKWQGLNTDAAITVPVGRVSLTHLKLIQTTKLALKKAAAVAIPQNHISDISHIIQKTIEAASFEPVRDCSGHGIGRNLHEEPTIPNFGPEGQGPQIKPGMVLAIEPMATEGRAIVKTNRDGWTISTVDGSFAAHFEDTIAITEKGNIILTK